MSQFNKIERIIARFLTKFPIIKNFTKQAYSRILYLKNKKSYAFKSKYLIKNISNNAKESYFGYYDKTPVSSTGFVIYLSSDSSTQKPPDSSTTVDLCYKKPEDDDFTLIDRIFSFNWQQGCRAHWLNEEYIIYNNYDYNVKQFKSKVFSINYRRIVQTFDYAVQDSFQMDYFISINYKRLLALRPDYGYYNGLPMDARELVDLENDGLWKVDFMSGKGELFITLFELSLIKPDNVPDTALHKVNHVVISPEGTRFVFLHRYFLEKRRVDRLILADSRTGELRLLANYGMVSHYDWVDENVLFGYMRGPDNKDGYWLIDVISGGFTRFANGVLDHYGDGHPHVRGDWFVTDTYPDKSRMQHLILGNWKTGETQEIGEFFHGFNYSGETRCDLHPRLSPDGRTIYFDSVFSGQRQLYEMVLPL